MRTYRQLQKALAELNVSAFCREHSLPLRTIMRIKSGACRPREGTMHMLDAALNREKVRA
jgi:hypothetical protein